MVCHLIGLNHGHQLEGYEFGNWRAFDKYLSDLCISVGVDLIAEELNEEGIARWRANGSVARTVALRLSIKHLFCDPNQQDRERLGLLTERDAAAKLGYGRTWTSAQDATVTAEAQRTWPDRERFWLQRLRHVQFDRCAFILGAAHVDTFGALLSAAGYCVVVVNREWA